MPLEHSPEWRTVPPKGCDPLVWQGAIGRAKAVHRADPYPTSHDVYEATIIIAAIRNHPAFRPAPVICKPMPADAARDYRRDLE